MSFSTGTRDRPDILKRSAESILDTEQLLIQRMKVFSAVSPDGGVVATGQESGNAPDIGAAFMASTNAIVSGAMSLTQAAVELVNNTIQVAMIDVDKAWTSFADIANAVSGDILDIIDGGDYSGQILKVKIPDGVENFVICNRNNPNNTTSNIFQQGIEDLTVQGGAILEFIYDTLKTGFQTPSASADGAWRVTSVSVPGLPRASFAVLGRDANQLLGNVLDVIEYDDNFFFGDTTRITETGTVGVFKLLAGFIYNAESLCALELNASGSGTEAFGVWQVSLAEGGPFTAVLAGVLSEEGQVLSLFNQGRDGFTTQATAIAVLIDASVQDVFIRFTINLLQGGPTIQWIFGGSGAKIETIGIGTLAPGQINSSGTYTSAVMSADQVVPSTSQHVQFNINDPPGGEDGGIVLEGQFPTFDQTSGVFQLLAGKSYYLEASLKIAFSTNAGNLIYAWSTTAGVQIGNASDVTPQTGGGNSANQTVVSTIFTPTVDTDVEVRLLTVNNVASITAASSHANLFEIGVFQQSGGGGGGDEVFTWTAPHDADGFNFILDQDQDTFWKGGRELADDWVQLIIGGNAPLASTIAINVSNRTNNEYVRIGLNLEPSIENGGPTIGTIDQRWDAGFFNSFVSFDNASPAQADPGDGRIFWNNTTRSFHQVDDANFDTDLAGSAADVGTWATFPAIADVIPDASSRSLGTATGTEQFAGLFLADNFSIRWNIGGDVTLTFLRGTSGGLEYNAPDGGSHIFDVDNTQAFKIDANQITVNAPVLDFASTTATIQDLRNLLFNTAGARIVADPSFLGFGPALLIDSDDSLFFQIGAKNYFRVFENLSGDQEVDFNPDGLADGATRLNRVHSILFDGDAVAGIATNKAQITANAAEDMFFNVNTLRSFNLSIAGVSKLVIDTFNLQLQNDLSNIVFQPSVGNVFRITKNSILPATFVTEDNFLFENPSSVAVMDLKGGLNVAGVVPSQFRFSGENSIGSPHTYGSIKTRIDSNVSGNERGDLELYGSLNGSDHEFITMKARGTFPPNNPLILFRDDVEMLFTSGASKFVLDKATLHMANGAGDPIPATLQNGVLYMVNQSGFDQLRFRFASGKIVILAVDN